MKTIFSTGELAVKTPSPHRATRRGGRWHSPAEILRILERISAGDQTIRDACKANQITMPTYYRWMKMRSQLAANPAPRRALHQPLYFDPNSAPPPLVTGDRAEGAAIAANAPAAAARPSVAVASPVPPAAQAGQPLFFPAGGHLAEINGGASPPHSQSERLAHMERENQHLRQLIVQLSAENLSLRKINETLSESLSQGRTGAGAG